MKDAGFGIATHLRKIIVISLGIIAMLFRLPPPTHPITKQYTVHSARPITKQYTVHSARRRITKQYTVHSARPITKQYTVHSARPITKQYTAHSAAQSLNSILYTVRVVGIQFGAGSFIQSVL